MVEGGEAAAASWAWGNGQHLYIYPPLAKWCAQTKSLSLGRRLHSHLLSRHGRIPAPHLAALILQMYANCGCVCEARAVFDSTTSSPRGPVSWNLMISCYARNGLFRDALSLFHCMLEEAGAPPPDKFSFLPALSAASAIGSLPYGKHIHNCVVAKGLDSDPSLQTAILSMYGKCGFPNHACSTFDRIWNPDIVSWTSMIAVYAHIGHYSKVLELLVSMDLQGVKPDKITFISSLDTSTNVVCLDYCREIHNRIRASGFESDTAVGNALLHMYSSCGSLNEAWMVFDRMVHRNVISWSSMIAALASNGCSKEALELFRQMGSAGVKPNRVTFLSLIEACSHPGMLGEARNIHDRVVSVGLDSVVLQTALVTMYAKCDSLKDAQAIFDEMQIRDRIAWNAIMAAYAQTGHGKEAFGIFEQMEREGVKPDSATFFIALDACSSMASLEKGRGLHDRIKASGLDRDDDMLKTAILTMYGKCGSLEDAFVAFDELHGRDVVSWTAMIVACSENGHCEESLKLFWWMLSEEVNPDKTAFLVVLDVCARMASLEVARAINELIVVSGFHSDDIIRNALLNVYCKCGSLKDAMSIFDGTEKHDVVSWTAMIGAYAQNGLGKKAADLLSYMNLTGLKPNDVTFLGIMNACNHAGLQDEGWQYFVAFARDYGLTPLAQHYGCMTDLLKRAGCVNTCEDFVRNMPVLPGGATWTTLLGAL